MAAKPLVIFGGTFDPVHLGHLRTALELAEWLGVDAIDLVPSRDPVHKTGTAASAQHRIAMLQDSVAAEPRLRVNPIEINSPRESYSIYTLEQLRSDIGPQRPLLMVMGMDAFLGLPSWHQWQRLLELASILVVSRPGYHPEFPADLQAIASAARVGSAEQLLAQPCGRVLFYELTPLGISATQIRELIAGGRSPRYLLPDSVWHYIQEHKLYGYNQG